MVLENSESCILNKILISVVVPVFNEEGSIEPFLLEIRAAMKQALEEYGEAGDANEVVFVDDGSTDGTFMQLMANAQRSEDLRIVKLSRNFGKEAALAAGLRFAKGDAVIPIDVDLQDPPQLILEMLRLWRCGAQVVNARRADRQSDTLIKLGSANAFYRLYNFFAERPIPKNVGDFRLFDRKVVDAINLLHERARFNKGLFSWVGYRTETVTYVRPTRAKGLSKWAYWRLWTLALDGIFSSTTAPLRIWSYIGSLVALASLLYAAFLVFLTLSNGADIPGYASLIVSTLFLGGLNLLSLGIMGEYIGRIANEVRDRPLYIVEHTEGFD